MANHILKEGMSIDDLDLSPGDTIFVIHGYTGEYRGDIANLTYQGIPDTTDLTLEDLIVK